MNPENRQSNHLKDEGSPYLIQHATNPVDWYPWGDEAFEKARDEGKLIFLSIGYSTCHWCHVMHHESFDDTEVAQVLNRDYVAIKVDREERPDIDNVYMEVSHLMNGNGGWPLNIIMTPDKKPFFASTYIPKYNQGGRVGLINLLVQAKNIWHENPLRVETAAQEIVDILKKPTYKPHHLPVSIDDVHAIYKSLEKQYDPVHGGFGKHPKFPMGQYILFLLGYARTFNHGKALEMAETTLEVMLSSGVYDQVGFGFHRYSTDREWRLPHYEKMLYDQAFMLYTYAQAYEQTFSVDFRHVIEGIISFVEHELRSPEGGYYAALDADSDGVEGRYYLWGYEELKQLFDEQTFDFVCDVFEITNVGNFKDEASEQLTGQNLLAMMHTKRTLRSHYEKMGVDFDKVLHDVQTQLYAVRRERYQLHRDTKILADWNGFMIAALAKAGAATSDSKYVDLAIEAYAFIRDKLWDGTKVHHCLSADKAIPVGFAEDYAALIWAVLELYGSTRDDKWLAEAGLLQTLMDSYFWDAGFSTYSQTSEMDTDHWMRPKTLYDNAYPSTQSISYRNLMKLYHYTEKPSYKERAEVLLKGIAHAFEQAPNGFAFLGLGLLEEKAD